MTELLYGKKALPGDVFYFGVVGVDPSLYHIYSKIFVHKGTVTRDKEDPELLYSQMFN
jgi:hypothetical protein